MKNADGSFRKGDNLLSSFGYALGGIAYSLVHERNFRIHCSVAVYVIFFARYYRFTRAEYALIVLLLGLVITCELFNTSIEKTVDLESPVFNPLAKIAKDVAAGAVLVSSATSVVVGFLLFWDVDTLGIILGDVLSRLYVWIPLVACTLAWIFVPAYLDRKSREQKRDKPQDQ